ncbi:general transcription factor II-I repeat domain-containing protein 2A isoform X1 [Oratosquilla oratoria]|uniref:general transcription factor II-I repeat domain-containing protein 2A isoform X1 n=1 Tax=Oratosquilla oratoria TaxID=337810 RepID=UPI003F76C026
MDHFVINLKRQQCEDCKPSTSQSAQLSSKERVRKRKKYSFQDDWETEYFIVENPDKTGVICLLCDSHLSGFRRSNCERHFKTNHSSCSKQYPLGSEERKVRLHELKQNFKISQVVIENKTFEENTVATLISYDIAHILAKYSRPFSDGEIMKKCIISAVERLSEALPVEYKKRLMSTANNIPLSSSTITRRVEHISREMKSNLIKKMASCHFMSLLIDESTDIGGVRQLLCFVRFVHDNGNVSEEFLNVIPISERATGEDIFIALMVFFKENSIDSNKLISLVTDRTPTMISLHRGLVAHLAQSLPDIIDYHCFNHVELFCNHIGTEEVKNFLVVIVKLINFLMSKPLSRRLLKLLHEEMQSLQNEFVMHVDVCSLSKGKTLSRVWELFDEIKTFLSENFSGKFPEIYSDDFKIAFSFYVDFLSILNELNLELQMKSKLVTDLYDTITVFQCKLLLITEELEEGLLHNFPELKRTLQECCQNFCPDYVKLSIMSLSKEFQIRFEHLKIHIERFELCCNPVQFDVNKLKAVFSQHELPTAELELCEMQASTVIKLLHTNSSCEDFWKTSETKKFPLIRAEALKVLCLFGRTCICEAAFSFVNNLKNKNFKKRARISQDHLEHCLRVALSSKEEVNLENLVSEIQSQGSH